MNSILKLANNVRSEDSNNLDDVRTKLKSSLSRLKKLEKDNYDVLTEIKYLKETIKTASKSESEISAKINQATTRKAIIEAIDKLKDKGIRDNLIKTPFTLADLFGSAIPLDPTNVLVYRGKIIDRLYLEITGRPLVSLIINILRKEILEYFNKNSSPYLPRLISNHTATEKQFSELIGERRISMEASSAVQRVLMMIPNHIDDINMFEAAVESYNGISNEIIVKNKSIMKELNILTAHFLVSGKTGMISPNDVHVYTDSNQFLDGIKMDYKRGNWD